MKKEIIFGIRKLFKRGVDTEQALREDQFEVLKNTLRDVHNYDFDLKYIIQPVEFSHIIAEDCNGAYKPNIRTDLLVFNIDEEVVKSLTYVLEDFFRHIARNGFLVELEE